ncbi:hypothetical protein [Methylobacterium sp. AMS5]|uniref:hypothetical protein n=1 Tax=Methylobacterium sp. AMS5 TaxID=925818 RepID=UPI000762D140|nr:hypothetical protein [Methylobacterium sp. AMS5]
MDLLLSLPLLTHFLLAALYTAAIGVPLWFAYGMHGLLVAAALVSTFFYGREAGQREHDLKRSGVHGLRAWLGATFLFLWSRSNVIQWLVPAGTALGAALLWGQFYLSKLPWL